MFIVSKDISGQAREKLMPYGELLLFESQNIVYPAIQNHPDIFLTALNNKSIVYAPNTPPAIIGAIKKGDITAYKGLTPVKNRYPFTAHYNAVVTEHSIIHKMNYTDTVLKETCAHLQVFNVRQGYCRCNLIALDDNRFLTSDKGIDKVLTANKKEVLYINPTPISLKGFSNGFFGGCCGLSDTHFFINGSLDYFKEAEVVKTFVKKSGRTIVELTDGRPEDVGSLIYLS